VLAGRGGARHALRVVEDLRAESLLILSDVHLGNDLTHFARGAIRRSDRVDTDLAALLAHYRDRPSPAGRWRLVIAGDFIDFVGMTIVARDLEVTTAPNQEERAHGLGNTADHARLKLRAVAARHRQVFAALADFVAAGHALTIVHGNHDVDFHWDAVKDELRAILDELAPPHALATTADGATPAAIGTRIDFAPWFYYVGGMAYVEHGHQYDTLCSTEHVMAPLSPVDPRRLVRSFSDVLLRWVVRPTRGIPEYGHDGMGLIDYVTLGLGMGAGGVVRLAVRFFAAVVELFRVRRASLSQAARALREEHERRIAALALATRLGVERLRALAALQVPPVTHSTRKILASVLLDRLALGIAAVTAAAVLVPVARHHVWAWPLLAAILVAWTVAHRFLSAQRRDWFGAKLDNDELLVERAGHLARLFPAAFVVMGHTHMPVQALVADGSATYVNVGSWHEPEPAPDAERPYRAARTHLVIHPPSGGGAPEAEFLAWSPAGPHKFVTPARVG
jgi:UDP-2,3-diacylglucosamine pyrophosphatase LpxH